MVPRPAKPDATHAAPLVGSCARSFFEETVGRRLLAEVAKALPEDVTVAFQLAGPGGGDWQVARTSRGPRVGPLQPGPKDCTVSCTASVFMGIVSGEVDARDAFLDGRLRLLGDIGLALRLQGVLPAGV
ncbi:SCP2 sterol-binding domain-containing protein [Myxococcota bacterium]|nr:SCP2 sterol-binding domain-containing protein [Myxococcota bacterium]